MKLFLDLFLLQVSEHSLRRTKFTGQGKLSNSKKCFPVPAGGWRRGGGGGVQIKMEHSVQGAQMFAPVKLKIDQMGVNS